MATRREALGALAIAGALPSVYGQHQHPAPEAAAGALPEPRVFSPPEFRLLTRLVDLIIPPTDTPGAAQAGIAHWIDAAVAEKGDRRQAVLKKGLAALDAAARKAHRKPFLELDETRQIALLTPWSEQPKTTSGRFFTLVKDLTIDIYYTTKAGLADELGYHGAVALPEFKGCTHPEHQV